MHLAGKARLLSRRSGGSAILVKTSTLLYIMKNQKFMQITTINVQLKNNKNFNILIIYCLWWFLIPHKIDHHPHGNRLYAARTRNEAQVSQLRGQARLMKIRARDLPGGRYKEPPERKKKTHSLIRPSTCLTNVATKLQRIPRQSKVSTGRRA